MTRVCFLFDETAVAQPLARHAMSTLASLLEIPSRLAFPGSGPAADEVPVFVGPAERAPAEAAAVIPFPEGGDWSPGRVGLRRFEDDPQLTVPETDAPGSGGPAFPAGWLRGIAFMLAREEERAEAHRDEWECFGGFSSRLHELGILDRPLVNVQARQLERRIRGWCEARHVGMPALPRWKDGARFAVVLSHDVDWVRRFSWSHAWRLLAQARGPRSYAFRHGLTVAIDTARHIGAADPYCTLDRWMAEEARYGFRSSFYFCAPDAQARHEYDPTYRFSDPVTFGDRRVPLAVVLRTMRDQDFEVGLHGSYLSHRDAALLASQKRRVESALGGPIEGIRQHYLRFDVRHTWRAQEAAGFTYDSTLGYNEVPGFRAGLAAPFHPWDAESGAGLRLLELPLTVMDGALFRTLKLSAALAARRVREHLEEVERVGGLAVLLWHPNATDTETCPGWWDCYRETLAWLATRPAWVTSGKQVAEWWLARERRLDREG